MAKGQPTVPATPAKSGGVRNESSSPDMSAARFAAATELSVSFDDEADIGPDAHDYEDYKDKTPAPEPGAATTETTTLSSGLSGATRSLSRNLADELDDVAGPEPAYDDYDDGTKGSKPSVASAKHSALLKAPRPPINGDTPAAKRVFDRVQALMQNDEWMQLFKPIPKRKTDWPALAQELQYPVNSVSTSQVAEDSVSLLLSLGFENETYPSTMSLQDWSPHEAGAALQKWKNKLRKAFGAVGISAGKQPVSRTIVQDEDPSAIPLPQTPQRHDRTPPTKRGAERGAFGTTEASPYFQDSHMVTPRSESRMQRVYAGNEGLFGRRGGPRAPKGGAGCRQVDSDGSSNDDDILVRTFDEEDPQVELMRQMNELATLSDVDPTPRIEMASHRPLDRSTSFSGSRNKSKNCMQWLRGLVYEMTGTHSDADKWCIIFELSLRDGAIHWFRQLPKKTKRKWKLLSDAFIRYSCSQFTQTALSRYYSAKRERKKHLFDYINRLNGYARTTRLHFEKSGRDAKEHVQQFLETCDDDKLAESLYHARVADIHELEEIIEDVLKGKKRMAKRDSEYRYSKNRDAQRDDGYTRNNRHDDRRRDDNRNKPRVTLIEATVDATYPNAYNDAQDEYNDFQPDNTNGDFSLDEHDRYLAAASENERRAAAECTYARSHNRQPHGNTPDRENGFNQERRSVDRGFNQDQRGRRDFNRDNRRPQYGPCAVCGGMSHSAHYCNIRCKFYKQHHDAGQCKLFRNFQDLAKFVRTKGTKEELPPELKAVRGFGVVSGAARDEPKGHSKMMNLNPGERLGWWSAKKFDRRIRMKVLVQGAVNDQRTRILLDTGASVGVITDTFAKKLQLRDVPDHGRRIDIQ
ncbi:hypothetical protein PInf_025239 [Phytophthora infestans]|nr:hypothetical protein PInf_025239 [Phytophthora infestans]